MRVLIVEDDIVIRSLLKVRINKQFAKDADFEIESVARLQEALAQMETFAPDVIILDLKLEDSEADETINAIPVLSYSAAVIVVSNGLTRDIIDQATSKGACDVVDKFTLSIGSLKDKLNAAYYKRIFSLHHKD